MAQFTVRQGKRYRATITLSWLESWANNDTIAEKLRAVGFADVSVTGAGYTRVGEATWPGPDTTAEMPSQLAEVKELTTPGATIAQP